MIDGWVFMYKRMLLYLYVAAIMTTLLACSSISYINPTPDQYDHSELEFENRYLLPSRGQLIVARKEQMSMEQFCAWTISIRESWSEEQNEQALIPLLPLQPHTNLSEMAGIVYLTFDDGPSPITEQVLDVLQERDIQATFFVLGQQVKRYPELAKRIVAEGHSIGNHSYNHVYEELYSNFSAFSEQITATTEEIWQTTGQFTPLVRAPGGTYQNFDQTYFQAMEEAGYILFDWNVDSGDSTSRHITAEQIVERVTASVIMPRLIVLMHDSSTHDETAAALPAIIDYYKELNYSFASLSDQSPSLVSRPATAIKWNRLEGKPEEIAQFVEATEQIKELAARREYLLTTFGPLREQ